ncbi:MAG: winged helix-turn-helix domain-containing protein [Phycisphaerales bacterium]|nr:winged helix-turn-helix domain-containing protein [Phycisphaerales bacterium]
MSTRKSSKSTPRKKTPNLTTRKRTAKKSPSRKSTAKTTTAKKKTASKKKPQRPRRQTSGPSTSKDKRLGVLAAAEQVLRRSKTPMRCREIIAAILKQSLWTTSGKTPEATLHAAIIREIANKGKDSRFEKTGRGLFRVKKGA